MRLNVCVNEMALFGPFAAIIINGKTPFDAMARKKDCSRDEIVDSPGTIVFPIGRHGFAKGFVPFCTVHYVV